MNIIKFYTPGPYGDPKSPSSRARTIAAFHLAQGDVEKLSQAEMRRDILNALTSETAVVYWKRQGWLEQAGKIGKTSYVRLTAEGLATCANSINGGSHVPTTQEAVQEWILRMRDGAPGFQMALFQTAT